MPEGSTSNLYRSRAALVGAVCDYLTSHDLNQMRQAAQRLVQLSEVTVAQAAELDVVLDSILAAESAQGLTPRGR